MHTFYDFVLFFSLAGTNYDSQTSRPPSEEKQLLQRFGESRSSATRVQREQDMTHTLSQRSESSSNSMRLLIVFHEEMKRGEIHLHLIKGFSVFLDSTLLPFMTSCPCAARFISGMGGTSSSCMPYIYTARAN